MPERLNQFLNSTSRSITGNFPRRETAQQLNHGEHSVLGYFPSNARANKALAQIREMGFEIAQLNQFNHSVADTDSDYSSSLTSLTAAPNYRMEGSHPFVVTVVTDAERASEVAKVMEEHGGYV